MCRNITAIKLVVLLYLLLASSMGLANKSTKSLVILYDNDFNSDNKFYQAAYNYFQTNPSTFDQTILRNPKSLLEITHYINNKFSNNSLSEIHLVTHASHWSGLSIPIEDGFPHTSSLMLNSYLSKNTSHRLDSDVYSSDIEITIHGCGVGINVALIHQLGLFFTDQSGLKPRIIAPKGYVFFHNTQLNDDHFEFKRTEIPIYEIIKPFEQKMSHRQLAESFKQKYPHAAIDWRKALEYPSIDFDNYALSNKKRTVVIESYGYTSDIKKFDSLAEYAKKHRNLRKQFEEFHAPPEFFSWTITETEQANVVKIVATALAVTIFDSSELHAETKE